MQTAGPRSSSDNGINRSTAGGEGFGNSPAGDEKIGSQEILEAIIAAKRDAAKAQEWAAWANNEYIKCRNARAPFERQWYLNLAFNSGRQYVSPIEVPGEGFRLTAPKAPPWRVRLVINKIRTAVRTETAKLTTNKPVPTVVPATNEDEDWASAAVGEALVKSFFDYEAFQGTYRSWIWWGSVTGNSFLKSFWDSDALDYDSMSLPKRPNIKNPKTGEDMPLPDQIVGQVPGMAELLNTPIPAKGKIAVERVTPFHLYVPDLLAEDIEDQPYVIEVNVKSPGWVRQHFGFNPVCDVRAASTIMNSAVIIAKGSEEHLDSVLVKEVWLKPMAHPDFPDGGMLTIINDRVVQNYPKWPLSFPEFPYYKYDGIETGGFYRDSVIVDLIPIQKEYNRTRSQMVEIKNTMGKPRLVYAKGSINPRMLSSEPGQSVPYTQGYEKPQIMPGVEVPTSMHNELDRLASDFDDISGQHEVSRGMAPTSQLTSGTAISFLSEQDDSKLAYQVASIEGAIEKLGKHYLKYVIKHWDEGRIVKVAGKNNAYEAIHYKKSALRGNTDVRIQTGSALPNSKAAKQALITEMMTNGWVSPEVGLEILDLGGYDKMVEDYLVDKRQAVRENMKMVEVPSQVLQYMLNPAPGPNGEPPKTIPDPQDPSGYKTIQLNWDGTPFVPQPPVPVNSYDDHEAHVKWHNHFRKSQEFENLDEMHKKGFELHVQMHQMALQAAIVNQQGMITQPGMGASGGGAPVGQPPMDQGPQQIADTPVQEPAPTAVVNNNMPSDSNNNGDGGTSANNSSIASEARTIARYMNNSQ